MTLTFCGQVYRATNFVLLFLITYPSNHCKLPFTLQISNYLSVDPLQPPFILSNHLPVEPLLVSDLVLLVNTSARKILHQHLSSLILTWWLTDEEDRGAYQMGCICVAIHLIHFHWDQIQTLVAAIFSLIDTTTRPEQVDKTVKNCFLWYDLERNTPVNTRIIL